MSNSIEDILKYNYKNKSYINTALTHTSFANDNNCESYEKMEFLGDTLLQTIVTIEIIKNKDLNEGELTKLRAKLVSARYLEKISDSLGITQFIKVGKSIKVIPHNIKADIIESIIASLYLDNGFSEAYKFVCDNILISDKNIKDVYEEIVDYKTLLQEKLGSKAMNLKYVLKEKSGLEHSPNFVVDLILDNNVLASCNGLSLKDAEQMCAKKVFNQLFK